VLVYVLCFELVCVIGVLSWCWRLTLGVVYYIILYIILLYILYIIIYYYILYLYSSSPPIPLLFCSSVLSSSSVYILYYILIFCLYSPLLFFSSILLFSWPISSSSHSFQYSFYILLFPSLTIQSSSFFYSQSSIYQFILYLSVLTYTYLYSISILIPNNSTPHVLSEWMVEVCGA
jgi:hypothetical protein